MNSRERKIGFYIVTYDVCLKWEFPRSCLRRSVNFDVLYHVILVLYWFQIRILQSGIDGFSVSTQWTVVSVDIEK